MSVIERAAIYIFVAVSLFSFFFLMHKILDFVFIIFFMGVFVVSFVSVFIVPLQVFLFSFVDISNLMLLHMIEMI